MTSATATAKVLRHEMLDACGKKAALTAEGAATLCRLLAVADVAVISGGDWRQSDRQVASRLPVDAARERQWLMPTTGTKLYRFVDDAWRTIYAELFDAAEKASIRAAFDRAPSELGARSLGES